MMAKPWAKATATIPLRPAPPPTTAAAPAPMKTNERVPMNSTRSFNVIRLDIFSPEMRLTARRDQVRQGTARWLGGGRRHGRAPPAGEASGLFRGDRLRFDAQRLCDAGAVGRIRLGAVGDMPLLNVFRSTADLAGRIVEKLLLLGRAHFAEEIARLLVVIVIDTMVPMRGPTFDHQHRLVKLRLVDPLAPA